MEARYEECMGVVANLNHQSRAAANLAPGGLPTHEQNRRFFVVQRRSQWRAKEEEFMAEVHKYGVLSLHPIATGPGGPALPGVNDLKMILVGTPRGSVIGFDQETLTEDETLSRVERTRLRKGVSLPRSLRQAMADGTVAVVGHDLVDRWEQILRDRGLYLAAALDTKKVFIKNYAAQASFCQTKVPFMGS